MTEARSVYHQAIEHRGYRIDGHVFEGGEIGPGVSARITALADAARSADIRAKATDGQMFVSNFEPEASQEERLALLDEEIDAARCEIDRRIDEA